VNSVQVKLSILKVRPVSTVAIILKKCVVLYLNFLLSILREKLIINKVTNRHDDKHLYKNSSEIRLFRFSSHYAFSVISVSIKLQFLI
jgi:hypothetical protein